MTLFYINCSQIETEQNNTFSVSNYVAESATKWNKTWEFLFFKVRNTKNRHKLLMLTFYRVWDLNEKRTYLSILWLICKHIEQILTLSYRFLL